MEWTGRKKKNALGSVLKQIIWGGAGQEGEQGNHNK